MLILPGPIGHDTQTDKGGGGGWAEKTEFVLLSRHCRSSGSGSACSCDLAKGSYEERLTVSFDPGGPRGKNFRDETLPEIALTSPGQSKWKVSRSLGTGMTSN